MSPIAHALRLSAKVKCKSDGALRQSAKVKCKNDVFPGGAHYNTKIWRGQYLFAN